MSSTRRSATLAAASACWRGFSPPQSRVARCLTSIARCCCGSSRISSSGSFRPTRSRPFALAETNKVVLARTARTPGDLLAEHFKNTHWRRVVLTCEGGNLFLLIQELSRPLCAGLDKFYGFSYGRASAYVGGQNLLTSDVIYQLLLADVEQHFQALAKTPEDILRHIASPVAP